MVKPINSMIDIEYSEKSTADLRGRQSVRTTFKLSERSIHALRILATQFGIKQKSLFDHLIDDIQALHVIAEASEDVDLKEGRVAKTFVVSRRTLENLEQVSNRFHTPRDVLVEFSIERIFPLLSREKKRHEKRKVLLDDLRRYLAHGNALVEKSRDELSEDDPVFDKILAMMRHVKNSYLEVEDFVKRGEMMEDF